MIISKPCRYLSLGTALCVILSLGQPALSQAQNDVLVLDDDSRAVVTGIITDIDYEALTINVDGKDLRVDAEFLDLEGDLDDFLSVGQTITVEGEYDAGGLTDIEASRIIDADNNDNVNVVVEPSGLSGIDDNILIEE